MKSMPAILINLVKEFLFGKTFARILKMGFTKRFLLLWQFSLLFFIGKFIWSFFVKKEKKKLKAN